MKTVRQLLADKKLQILSIEPDNSVYEALQLMAEMEIGALLVMEGGNLAGIFSERDYARNVVLKGKTSKTTRVREIMSSRLTTVSPQHTVEDCMNLMSDKRIRHLPVLEDGKVIGVLSIGDLVKETITYQQFLISQLESYIQG